MSGAITYKAFSGAPTGTPYEGELATREDAPNGSVYVGKNGVWTPLLTTTAGGTVTLAGDVTGPSGANTVVVITGAAGIVTMIANELQWAAADAAMSITQAPQTIDHPSAPFLLRLSAPYAGATGVNRNSPSGTFDIPTPASGGTPGRWAFRGSGIEEIAFETTRVLVGVSSILFASALTGAQLGFLPRSGHGNAMSLLGQTSTDDVGGDVILGSGNGGLGNLPGNVLLKSGPNDAVTIVASAPQPIVHFNGNTVRWSENSTPILTQVQRTSDTGVPRPMRFRSQDPYGGATDHGGGNDARLAGNIEMEIGTSVNGADQLGHYVWSIAETQIMSAWVDRLELRDIAIRFVYTGSAPLIDVQDATAGAGVPILIIGQRGFDDRGGDIIVKGGTGGPFTDGGGFIAQVGAVGQPQIQAQQLGSKYVVALGMPAILTVSDIPPSNSNYLLLGDAYNVDDIDGNVGVPGASLIASWAGRPLLQGSDGSWIRFDGTVHSGPVGAVLAYVDVTLNGNPYCVELIDRSP